MLLQFQIELDPEYIAMTKHLDPCKHKHQWVLKSIIQRLTTGAIIVENPRQTFVDVLYNLLFIKDDNFTTLFTIILKCFKNA